MAAKTTGATSLLDFANSRKRVCEVCPLSKRIVTEIDEAWKAGVRGSATVAWLKQVHNIDIHVSKVRSHFQHLERNPDSATDA